MNFPRPNILGLKDRREPAVPTLDLYREFVLPTYNPTPLMLESGRGSWVWDEAGHKYLDFTSGIAVTTLGHGNRRWLRRFLRQSRLLIHTSNVFGHANQGLLARRISTLAGAPGKVFFCNSGTEANEALIKLARLHGRALAGGEEGRKFKIVCARNGFHGRTMGSLSATPKEKVQQGYAPLLPGFVFAEYNNLEAFTAAVDDQTAAILVETIQGEGGIYPAKTEFLQGLRKLCDERGLLLLIDEVQCGIARSGTFFAYEIAGIQPDAIGLAKGLGNGFPIGAIWVAAPSAGLFTQGSHGTTFGGSPLACAAGLATLDIIEEMNLVTRVYRRGRRLLKRLNALWGYYPDVIKEVRGRGFMFGLELKIEAAPVVAALRAEGLLVVAAGTHVFRLLPPLTVKQKEIRHALAILEKVLSGLSQLNKSPTPTSPTSP